MNLICGWSKLPKLKYQLLENRFPPKTRFHSHVWVKHSNRANRSFFVQVIVCQNRKLKVTERENLLTRQAALTLTAILV